MQDQKKPDNKEANNPDEGFDKTARSFDHTEVDPDEDTLQGADPTARNFQRMEDESDVKKAKGPNNEE
ncbi:hypothetical protein [Telluribacter sp. SYSU D00476]|uniref:hypothetical protein n=1 Tax=Telluribacter sp. SYSU D00476 TaxID=2811430 RepID=UPI001FF153E6|nr:hypothetical protein [Telluribacter sp. SYSU D00476]